MRLPRLLRAAFALCSLGILIVVYGTAFAAPYAAMVMDARTGEVLHSRNADTRLHPASLTKMMTLYVVFDAIEKGEVGLDDMVTISRFAASEPPSKLGLRAGQKIKLRYLIRAAAVKSANDAATAIGEAVSGSEAAFARRMNRMAQAMGMTRTTFRNAHGLTESGHLSTARDMTKLGRHLFYDFPEYYNLFSRRSTHAGVKAVNNTNRRLLNAYRGADGIKTGYTRAAGYNLVASAERGSERVIATVFGGRTGAWRNRRVAELLDMGFSRAPTRVAVRKPVRPVLGGEAPATQIAGLVERSPRPAERPVATPTEATLVAMADGITDALAEVAVADTSMPEDVATAGLGAVAAPAAPVADLRPSPRPIVQVAAQGAADPEDSVRVVTRMATSGGRQWAINVGYFPTRHEAEKMLLKTALVEIDSLDDALRKVVHGRRGYEANFVGMSEIRADLACRRLVAQDVPCTPVGPGSS